ncbi:hypothetical protein CALVIDRAFT_561806 [Calocera viscosa TUFC12733]|uniref:Galactose oxidase n=1 Tax=Calocera viscosa (strain TUFC12733) TaxID=1330018 RepID=A0A167PJV9_CALVF|nr:hypothetical protein CALVIDRAFT_561806 [Calocera viscosa TUFC12733]
MSYKATWQRLPTASATGALTRSSHCVQAYQGTAYVFAGELKPRDPVPSTILGVALDTGAVAQLPASAGGKEPAPRVGPTWSKYREGVYLFGGRGGPSMEPMDAELWRWDLDAKHWEEVQGMKGVVPEGRSYHAAAVLGDDLYIHAGCPTTGRLSTLDKYHIPSATWSSLAPAPGPPRGGTVLAPSTLAGKPVLLRFGGFGGPEFGELRDLAYYDVPSCAWVSVEPKPGQAWPEARSVHGLVGLPGAGPELALLFMGEGTPAPAHLGHSGAGNFLSDVWVLTHGADGFGWHEAPSAGEVPQGRGWFASDGFEFGDGEWKAIVSGGLNEKNERMGDVWVLTVTKDA